MKANKLIYLFLLTVLTSFSSQSFAILATMDAEGYVTGYTYSGDIDPFGGSISIGESFSSVSGFDTDGIDANLSSSVGAYSFSGEYFGTNATIGANTFSVGNITGILIQDNILVGDNEYDIYVLNSVGWLNENERLVLTLYQMDASAQAFSDDSLVLEPSVDLFDLSRFWVTSYNLTGDINYRISGNLTSLVDPPRFESVPEPNTIFLLGLGLIAVFFASRKGRKEEAFTA